MVKYLIIPKPITGKTIEETVDIARKIIKASEDAIKQEEKQG